VKTHFLAKCPSVYVCRHHQRTNHFEERANHRADGRIEAYESWATQVFDASRIAIHSVSNETIHIRNQRDYRKNSLSCRRTILHAFDGIGYVLLQKTQSAKKCIRS
jgi:hypothetical protein